LLLNVAKEEATDSQRISSEASKQGTSGKTESAWQLRASIVQKAASEVEPMISATSKETSNTGHHAIELSSNHKAHEKNALVSPPSSNKCTTRTESRGTDIASVSETPFRLGPRHAALIARLSKLKASRLRRAAALKNLRSNFRFLPYGSRGQDNCDDRSLGTRESSTHFGGSSFMAALDVD
jgi:hypothetical protein